MISYNLLSRTMRGEVIILIITHDVMNEITQYDKNNYNFWFNFEHIASQRKY